MTGNRAGPRSLTRTLAVNVWRLGSWRGMFRTGSSSADHTSGIRCLRLSFPFFSALRGGLRLEIYHKGFHQEGWGIWLGLRWNLTPKTLRTEVSHTHTHSFTLRGGFLELPATESQFRSRFPWTHTLPAKNSKPW